MSLIFATQLTAAATLALAALALATAILALLAWRKQSREVHDQAEMLRLQAKELKQVSAERDREARERRQAQAALVYMWESPAQAEVDGKETPAMTLEAYVRNTSPQPIYDVEFEWRIFTSDLRTLDLREISDETYEGPLMPGAQFAARVPVDPGLLTDPEDATATVTFRDRAGVWWRAQPNGRLEELPGPGSVHRGPDDGAPAGETAPDVGQ